MADEKNNQGAGDEAMQRAAAAVKQAVSLHGATHREVLKKLEEYVALLHQSGKSEEAGQLEKKAAMIRQALKSQEAGGTAPAPAGPPAQSDRAPAGEPSAVATSVAQPAQGTIAAEQTSLSLYNSRGEHIAVAFEGHIYTPHGKHLGRWLDQLNAFVDREGWYFGEIVEENRLARDPNWLYRQMSFGNKGNEGDRAGWPGEPDTHPVVLERGYEDVKIGSE